MAKPKASTKSEEVFGGVGVSYEPKDIETADRNLENELFGKLDAQKTIDDFEKSKGIITKRTKVVPTKKKTIRLNMSKATDVALLEDLMNKPEYTIIEFTKFYSPTTDKLSIFIIYTVKQIEDNKKS